MVDEVRRRVVTTTISADTEQFFKDNPNLVVGRSLDVWVAEQRERVEEEKENKFAARIAALQTGGCKCGRIIYPSRRLQKEVCPGCMGIPASCGCQATLALREKYFLEWQADREKSGVNPTAAEMESKRTELGLDDREWRRKQFEKITAQGREARFLSEAGERERLERERKEIDRIANMSPEETAAHVAKLRELQGGEQYGEYRGPPRGAKGAKVRGHK